MYKTNNFNPFKYSSKKDNLETHDHFHRKNSSLSPDKIYFFRTSLFTEKSKNFILQMTSFEKNKTINSSNIIKEVNTPKINTFINPPKTSIKLKKGKINFSNNKNVNKSDIESNDNLNLKEKSELSRNPITNKSSNDLIPQKITNKMNDARKENKSMTVDKKESINNQNKNRKKLIAIKNLKKVKNEKKITPLNNIINANNNNEKTLIANYFNQNHSLINLVNAHSKQKQIITKNIVPKIETNHKIKYRLKSQKDSKQKTEKKNIISFKGIKNKNLEKELKYLKVINNIYNKKSTIFDENLYISRYKLGYYHGKRNNRYANIHSNFNVNNNMNSNSNVKSTMLSDSKKTNKNNNFNRRTIFI